MVWVSVGLVLVVLGVFLAARAAWAVRAGEQRGRSSTGGHGMGIALGAGVAFWGAVITTIALLVR
ncbi:hypothetical protein [Oerskovia jenensis]|uniref:hypothetical protein n=1 Tax=Oerskovia jenensis TaxID=162169 RepID=UPI0036D99F3A